MTKKLMLTLMSGLLILTSCFSTVLASEISHTNEKSYAINLDKVATHVTNTAKNMITWGGASFGLAFMPAGTPLFAVGHIYIWLRNDFNKMTSSMSETEKSWRDLETGLIVGAGLAGHVAGWYLLLKAVKMAIDSL